MIEVELLDDDRVARDFNPVLLTVNFNIHTCDTFKELILILILLSDTRFYNQSIDWQQMDAG